MIRFQENRTKILASQHTQSKATQTETLNQSQLFEKNVVVDIVEANKINTTVKNRTR
jgi:hypothetical protein